MKLLRKALKVVLPLLVVALGIGVFRGLVESKPEAQRAERAVEGALVEAITVEPRQHEVNLIAQGTVIPARRVIVQPEAAGRITWLNPALVPGGRLRKGEKLARIDAREYELAVEARRAEVSRARTELRLERSRQSVAEKEWQMFGERENATAATEEEGGVLALRQPQLETAKVAVESAQSALNQAELTLSKTTIVAPFNALVVQETAELGQLVTQQAQLATLVGTDQFWVQVAIPVEALGAIDIPGVRGQGEGSLARVYQQVGTTRIEREGRVVQLLADLDAGGAMARILVAIDDPLGLTRPDGELPMLLNSYVSVEIGARPIENAFEIPRAALREGSRVFVVTAENTLGIRPVTIVWRREKSVIVSSGIAPGDRVITSRIAAPAEGMPVRVAETSGAASPSREEASRAAPVAKGENEEAVR